MAFRHALLAATITGVAGVASAQTRAPASAPSPPPAGAGSAADRSAPSAAEAKTLIGRTVRRRGGDPVGKIESVYVMPDGKVDSVMLSFGDHEVQVVRKDLQIVDRETVTTELTRDQVLALPPYRYEDPASRGKVFGDCGVWRDDQRPTADADRTESTGDFNVAGDVSATAMIGRKILNQNRDTVGTVEDLFVDDRGAISTVVVSVAGFLGIGGRSVGLKWSDLRRSHDGNFVVLTTALC
jgi:sporulation protein YlmC with PRC-barrel domain